MGIVIFIRINNYLLNSKYSYNGLIPKEKKVSQNIFRIFSLNLCGGKLYWSRALNLKYATGLCAYMAHAPQRQNNIMNLYKLMTFRPLERTEAALLEATLAERCPREEALTLLAFMSVCLRKSSTRPRRLGVAKAPIFFFRFSSALRSSRTLTEI